MKSYVNLQPRHVARLALCLVTLAMCAGCACTPSQSGSSSSLSASQSEPTATPAPTATPDPTSAPTATPEPTVEPTPAPIPVTIQMTVEGETEEIPALQYQKDGYTVAIPENEWLELDTDQWQAQNNENVRFTVIVSEESRIAAVANACWGEEGEASNWLDMPAQTRYTEDWQFQSVLATANDGELYCYAHIECPAEAVEGFGIRMAYMAQNIALIPRAS